MGKPRIFTEAEKTDIVAKASNGISRRAIGDEYHAAVSTITKLLNELGTPYKDYSIHENRIGRKNKYGIDHYYFDKIDTVNKAYILGFLFADGTNISNGNYVCIQLQEDDSYILEEIKQELGCSNLPLKSIITHGQSFPQGYSDKVYFSKKLVLNSVHLNERLEELGMFHKKSCVIEFPKEVPYELFNSFLLGYFDGNGSIVFNENKKKSHYVGIHTGSLKFCEQLQSFASDKLLIKSSIQQRGEYSYCWYIYDRYNMIKFLDYIYTNHDLCLTRKYEKYISFCEYVDRLSKEPFCKSRNKLKRIQNVI